MKAPFWISADRTISLPSTRVYEDEQPEAFAALHLAAMDFNRAKVFLYNLRYDEKWLGAAKTNTAQALKEWSRRELGYQLPEYYITSVENRVSGLLKAQGELFKTQEADRARIRASREEKIESLKTSAGNLSRMKAELIAASREGRAPVIPPIYKKRYADIKKPGVELSDGEKNYLFECSIDQSLTRAKANIGRVRQKIHRAEQKHKDIPSRLTFGTKALYKLKDTGDMPPEEWRVKWHDARNGGLYFAGRHTSKDCNFLVTILDGGAKIRVPGRETGSLETILARALTFPYRGDELIAALGRPKAERGSVSYDCLFRRDSHGRRYFILRANFTVHGFLNASLENGLVGVDCNIDNFALADLSADGRVLATKTVPFDLTRASAGEADDILGRAACECARWAQERGKPMGMEDLDLRLKRASMEYQDRRLNGVTARFAYRKMAEHLEGACFSRSIGLAKVDPAYTSLIGKTAFLMRRQGPIHESAAIAIGRRILGCRERVPSYLRPLITKKLSTAASWKQWRSLYKKLSGVPLPEFRKRMAPLDSASLKKLKPAAF